MAKVRINWGAAPEDRPVRLFEVYNTAHRSLLVLAPDRSSAIEIAHSANHIHWIWNRKDISYPHAAEVRDPLRHEDLADCVEPIQAAIAQRLQGTVHREGDHVCVGYQVLGDCK